MKTKISKEELLIANAELKKEAERWASADERRRREFAKAFSWFKTRGYGGYNSEQEPLTPSWEQVFVNVGYLCAQRDFRNYEGNISELEHAVADIQSKLNPPSK